tara:strand:+ start:1244 stop:1534 length:291 start_codon:yes stop_codon:yes gene_type:complete
MTTANKTQIVFTRGINDRVADDAVFAKFIVTAMNKFRVADWGDTAKDDHALNDADLKALDAGNYGRILAKYIAPDGTAIFITRDTEAVVIMFPEEY